jgi:hypothetical protein
MAVLHWLDEEGKEEKLERQQQFNYIRDRILMSKIVAEK